MVPARQRRLVVAMDRTNLADMTGMEGGSFEGSVAMVVSRWRSACGCGVAKVLLQIEVQPMLFDCRNLGHTIPTRKSKTM